MTQLMMWKRNGKEERGVISKGNNYVLFLEDELMFYYPIKEITDLQPAKAVPLDAIVISKELYKWMEEVSKRDPETSGWNRDYWKGVSMYAGLFSNRILSENPHLVKPEPMKEPTNFGAIVEAHTNSYARQQWVRINEITWETATMWRASWHDLINPVLISEGVVGK